MANFCSSLFSKPQPPEDDEDGSKNDSNTQKWKRPALAKEPISPTALSDFMKQYSQWPVECKWMLNLSESVGSAVAEDIMFQYFKHMDTEELGHSCILELDNVLVQQCFSEAGLEEGSNKFTR